MKKERKIRVVAKASYGLSLLAFVIFNLIPLNNRTSLEIYKKFDNLFLPTVYSFLILIPSYWLIGRYFLYALRDRDFLKSIRKEQLLYFILESLGTFIWLFAWHYENFNLTILAIGLVFIGLYRMSLNFKKQALRSKEEELAKAVFDFYLGWISIRFISNAFIFLESQGLLAFGVSNETWTLTFLILGLLFSISILDSLRSEYYGFGVLWAYGGVVLRHILSLKLAFRYRSIIGVSLMVIGFIGLGIYDIRKRSRNYLI